MRWPSAYRSDIVLGLKMVCYDRDRCRDDDSGLRTIRSEIVWYSWWAWWLELLVRREIRWINGNHDHDESEVMQIILRPFLDFFRCCVQRWFVGRIAADVGRLQISFSLAAPLLQSILTMSWWIGFFVHGSWLIWSIVGVKTSVWFQRFAEHYNVGSLELTCG